MIRFLLLLTAIVAIGIAAVSQVPTGFVLRKLPLNAMGVQWTQSEGTIWDGRIMGVYLNGQPVGDIDIALQPLSLVSMRPVLNVQWGGAGGRGAGQVMLDGDAISATDLRLEQQVSALESLTNELRAIGGVFRLNHGAVRIENGVCLSAVGDVQTDTLARAAQQFGRTFTDLTGSISCTDGAFNIVMDGNSPDGDTIAIDANATLTGRSNIDVVVSTADRDIETLLANAGFSRNDGVWTYQRVTETGGRLQP